MVVVLSSAPTQQHKSLWEPTRQRKHRQHWELQGCKPCQGKDTAKAPGHYIPNSPGATALLGRAGRELTESKATELRVLHPLSSSTHSKPSPFEKSHVPLGSQQMLCCVCRRFCKESETPFPQQVLGGKGDFCLEKHFPPFSWKSWTAFGAVHRWLLLQTSCLLFLFNQFWNHWYLKKKKKDKNKLVFCIVMTQITHIVPHSPNHLGCELKLAPCQYSSPAPVTQNSERLEGRWEMLWLATCPAALTKTKRCVLRPSSSAICLEAGSPRAVSAIAPNPKFTFLLVLL